MPIYSKTQPPKLCQLVQKIYVASNIPGISVDFITALFLIHPSGMKNMSVNIPRRRRLRMQLVMSSSRAHYAAT